MELFYIISPPTESGKVSYILYFICKCCNLCYTTGGSETNRIFQDTVSKAKAFENIRNWEKYIKSSVNNGPLRLYHDIT